MKTENEIKISIKERDLISVYMYQMTGLYSRVFNWNDIMPVVKKIGKYTLKKECKSKKQFSELVKHWNVISIGLVRPDLKQIVKGVIQWIKWYNSKNS